MLYTCTCCGAHILSSIYCTDGKGSNAICPECAKKELETLDKVLYFKKGDPFYNIYIVLNIKDLGED